MKFVKSFLMGTGAVVVAGLVLTLVAPKAARAIAATAVQVENTRSAPVPNQDVDIAARHQYTAECYSNSPGTEGGEVTCSPTPAPPTSGFETVIQNISIGIAALSGTGMPGSVGLVLNTAGNQFYPVLSFAPQGPGFWALDQPTTIYLDPNTQSSPLICDITLPAGLSANMNCTVIGYTVSLP